MLKVVEPAGEAKAINEYIVVCRDSWEAYYKSMSTDEVDKTAFGYYCTSVDQLEEHGYAVEENGGTLDIFLEDAAATAYDPTFMVMPSAFLKLEAMQLSSLTEMYSMCGRCGRWKFVAL